MDYFNIKTNDKPDGISLVPMLQRGNQDSKKVFIQYDGNGAYGNNQRCVVDGEFKLIMDTYKDEIFLELYNLKKDPQETVNLAADPKYESIRKKFMVELRETHGCYK